MAVTLVELLIVCGVLALLAGLGAGVSSRSLSRAREAGCMNNLRQLYVALQLYQEDQRRWPAGLHELVPTYTDAGNLLCPADSYGGYWTQTELWCQSYGAGIYPGIAVDGSVPTSYLYAGSFFPDWYGRLSRVDDAACLVCQLHGEVAHQGPPGGMPYLEGLAIRVRIDGSVVAERTHSVTVRRDAWGEIIEVGNDWMVLFDPAARSLQHSSAPAAAVRRVTTASKRKMT